MMDINKHEIERIKNSVNIVDIINRYLPLKKRGKDYWACCPFHGEKTPSFSVVESGQYYHCHGCGAHGDVISFIQEYNGVEFMEAYQALGGHVELQPTKKVLQNIKRNKANKKISSLPHNHKQAPEKMNEIMSMFQTLNIPSKAVINNDHEVIYLIIDCYGEIINGAYYGQGGKLSYVAGGISYNGFTPIKVNETNQWLACVDIRDGLNIARRTRKNVAVCWNEWSLEYVCKSHHADMKVRPVLTPIDCDDLAYEMDHILYDGSELKVQKRRDL